MSAIGIFGDYKYKFSNGPKKPPSLETVWVSKSHDPTDMRSTAPAPRHKPIIKEGSVKDLSPEWLPPHQRSLREINRANEEKCIYPSYRITRCEDWSTLREMLPSQGRPERIGSENWGTSMTDPPSLVPNSSTRHPMINSAMSRYVDDMNLKHRQFKMY
ncbi:uncharacterized protein LOC120346316 [Styela clava]